MNSLAAALLELGFEKNDRLAVWLPNRSENVVLSFAASKLGLIKVRSCSAFIQIGSISLQVNINPAYVGRELAYCINKVGCKGLLLSPAVKTIDSLSIFRRLAPELDQQSFVRPLELKELPTLKHVILTGPKQASMSALHSYADLVERGAKISHQQLNERQDSINPDAPLAIFYTSGTTGQPKAAMLSNFNMVNMVQNVHQHLGEYFTRLCVPIPMFHIFSEAVGVLLATLSKCEVIFPAFLPDSVATMRAIQEEKCTAMIGAPIIFRDILNHPDRKNYDLSSLEYSGLGASPMHIDFLRQLEKEIPIKRVAQLYGMTENVAILTSSMWAGDGNEQQRLSSLGQPMPRLEMKVADQQGNAVPIGQQGEIWARGFPVMAGYYGDPGKTSEAITSAGWLRTGDEATMDEDGYLYYVGRQKEMIIRGGVNIYPMEIEKIISEHESVVDAQVFAIPDARYGEEVCAWIKLKPDARPCQPDEIKTFLADKIAFFKIPKHIRIVEKFFMTPTGKVQKFKMSQAMVDELSAANKE